METKLYFSVFSGTIYEVCADETQNLDAGQIPLTGRPKPSCKKCYGRGFIAKDAARDLHYMCTCTQKLVEPGYVPQNIQVPMEKFR